MTGPLDRLDRWLAEAEQRLETLPAGPRLDQVGRVERIGDGIALVSGLPETRLDEALLFEGGIIGLTVELGQDSIGCVLLGESLGLAAGQMVHGTGTVLQVPVGDVLLGRVVDPLGRPLDNGAAIAGTETRPVEQPAPAIVDRALVTRPLATGVLVIDSMFPIGRGQRELIIGDRSTGKTAIAIDTMINQRESDVICVYVAIGQKSSSIEQVIDAVRRHGAIERCVFVIAEADQPAGLQWLAPYAGFSIAEFFRDRGQDVLIVVDDLTKHAAVHREVALLLRQPPGREAYPGDVFYIHARMLERAGQLSPELGGGSLTALPIAETQAGNLSAYIPTNLISITDGQIYLDAKLFYEGQKPAVDVGRSVSRVGGKSQRRALRDLSESLRLDYAQFLELEVFTRFGGAMGERTRHTIDHGRRIRALLAQPQYRPRSFAMELAALLALAEGLLDPLPPEAIPVFLRQAENAMRTRAQAALAKVGESGDLDADSRAALRMVLKELSEGVATPSAAGEPGP